MNGAGPADGVPSREAAIREAQTRLRELAFQEMQECAEVLSDGHIREVLGLQDHQGIRLMLSLVARVLGIDENAPITRESLIAFRPTPQTLSAETANILCQHFQSSLYPELDPEFLHAAFQSPAVDLLFRWLDAVCSQAAAAM